MLETKSCSMPLERHRAFGERDALHALHLRVGGQQQLRSVVRRGIRNGSLRNGFCQVSTYAFSGARATSAVFASDEAFAIATACAAQACTPSRVSKSVEAKPHEPFAITRIPIPSDLAFHQRAHFAVFRAEVALADVHHSRVGIRRAAPKSRFDRPVGPVLHHGRK